MLIKGGVEFVKGVLFAWSRQDESVSCGSWGELQKKECRRKLQESFEQDA